MTCAGQARNDQNSAPDDKRPEPAPKHAIGRGVLQREAVELLRLDGVAQLAQALETFDLDLDRLVARGFEIRDAIAERLQLFPRGLVGHRHTR